MTVSERAWKRQRSALGDGGEDPSPSPTGGWWRCGREWKPPGLGSPAVTFLAAADDTVMDWSRAAAHARGLWAGGERKRRGSIG